jgi:hypothetical protein
MLSHAPRLFPVSRVEEEGHKSTLQHTLSFTTSELYRPSDHRLSAKLVPTLRIKGCRVVSATNPHGGILDFLDRSRYYFLQVAPQLYSRG